MLGIDCASVDDGVNVEWGTATREGRVSFALVRGAYGDDADAAFERSWRALKDNAVPRGAYLFLRFPLIGRPPPADPTTQAERFAATIGDLGPGDFPPTIDVEFESKDGRAGTGLTAAQAIEWVAAAWRVLAARYRAAPLIYTSARIWQEELDDAPAPELVDSPLWLAKPWPWSVRSPAHRDTAFFDDGRHDPGVPTPWGSQWFIHQYQGDALGFPGFPSTVDINRFRPIPLGATGDHVRWIQRRLGIATSGTFDAATRDATIVHQRAHGLVADGVVGPRTFASLCWAQTC